jgi:hypothetical protein
MPAVTIGGAQRTPDSDGHTFVFGVAQDQASTVQVQTDQRVMLHETIGDPSFDGIRFFVVELPADAIVTDFTTLRRDNSTFIAVSSEELPYGSPRGPTQLPVPGERPPLGFLGSRHREL